MNELNFTNEKYKNVALSIKYIKGKTHSPSEAFFVLINGI